MCCTISHPLPNSKVSLSQDTLLLHSKTVDKILHPEAGLHQARRVLRCLHTTAATYTQPCVLLHHVLLSHEHEPAYILFNSKLALEQTSCQFRKVVAAKFRIAAAAATKISISCRLWSAVIRYSTVQYSIVQSSLD